MRKISKMKNARIWTIAVFLIGMCGCNAVFSKRPVGEKPAGIVAKDWEGNWQTPDGTVRIKVIDPGKGMLRALWIEDDKQGNPIMKTADVEIRQSGEWLFANTKDDDVSKNRGYFWGRIRNKDRQIIVWVPDEKAFVRLVKNGTLPGKIDGDDVILDELTSQHLKRIMSGDQGVLFAWDEPVVFVKQGN